MKKGAISTKHSILLIFIIVAAIVILLILAFRGDILNSDKSLLNKVDISLRIQEVEIINENSVKMVVKCNKAQENLIGMRVVFETESSSETVDVNHSIKEGEEWEFTISLKKITSDGLKSVKIYPIMELENKELSVGSIKDEYNRFYN